MCLVMCMCWIQQAKKRTQFFTHSYDKQQQESKVQKKISTLKNEATGGKSQDAQENMTWIEIEITN